MSAQVGASVDPTKPLMFGTGHQTSQVIAKQELTLQTIIERDNKISVVINGQLLNVGDNIEQYKVITIEGSSVLLSSPEKNLKLSLFSSVLAHKNEK